MWTYFFFEKLPLALQSNLPEGMRLSVCRFESISSIKGEPEYYPHPQSNIYRLETPSALLPSELKIDCPYLIGCAQHLQYTDQPKREELLSLSTPEYPSSSETYAVLIPIRKNSAWWAMASDERLTYLKPSAKAIGHIAIGLPFASKIFRKLYHSRYLEKNHGVDFLTYFEFPAIYYNDFIELLKNLRDINQNPEWDFVDREWEIWMRKTPF